MHMCLYQTAVGGGPSSTTGGTAGARITLAFLALVIARCRFIIDVIVLFLCSLSMVSGLMNRPIHVSKMKALRNFLDIALERQEKDDRNQ